MNTYFFSKEKLQSLTMKDLRALADYYSLNVPKNISKPAMVELLFVKQKDFISSFGGISMVEEPQMSVRIRRIKEANKGA